jgi:hypothetical protein
MAQFTLPATRFPAVGKSFLVGVPLKTAPPMQASGYITALEASSLYYIDDYGNVNSVSPDDFQGPPPWSTDFVIPGGKGFLAINGKDPRSGHDIVWDGDGWCNVWSGDQSNVWNPQTEHVTDCP